MRFCTDPTHRAEVESSLGPSVYALGRTSIEWCRASRDQAEARATGDRIEVTMGQEPITGIKCPESLIRYVIRTLESVILDDASKPNEESPARIEQQLAERRFLRFGGGVRFGGHAEQIHW